MPNANLEKNTYGTFERFMYLFLFPIFFTAILTVILLSIFDYDVMNAVLKTANKIPVVEKMVPDAKSDEPDAQNPTTDTTSDGLTIEQRNESLTLELKQMQSSLEETLSSLKQREQRISELELEIEQLNSEKEDEQITEQEYLESIQRLASTYANMMPSRSAAIIQNLTMSEMVLMLNEMRSSDQIKILEKMNPRVAAEASILLKDISNVEDIQIAALQERLQVYRDREPADSDALSDIELAQTFASMNAKDAAEILIEMRRTNNNQVISILRSMAVVARSNIISEISKISENTAADISNQLGE